MYHILPVKMKIQESAKQDLPAAHFVKLRDAFQDIERSPYSHPEGLIDLIRSGRYKGIWHYRLNGGYRFHYTVDESAKAIQIVYIGPHPKY